MGTLDGKVAFITGAARGQGRSHALRLARDGARIIGIDLCANIATNPYALGSREELDETQQLVEKEGSVMLASVADVRDYAQVKKAVDKGVKEFGRLDIVCANAGVSPITMDAELSDELELQQWTDVIAVNLTGVFYTTKATIPHLIAGDRGGSIILTSSTAGVRGFGGWIGGSIGYTAAKTGVVGMMRSISNGLAPYRIRVNAVVPTAVRTAMALYYAEHNTDGLNLQNALPIDMVEPEDISAGVAFLASDESRYVTGTVLPVDAGFCNRVG